MIKKCKYCGNDFYAPDSRRSNNLQYCSDECKKQVQIKSQREYYKHRNKKHKFAVESLDETLHNLNEINNKRSENGEKLLSYGKYIANKRGAKF